MSFATFNCLKFNNFHFTVVHKSELVNAWCLPFLGSDRSVVLRSQRFLYEHEQKRPVQIQTYMQFKYDYKLTQLQAKLQFSES